MSTTCQKNTFLSPRIIQIMVSIVIPAIILLVPTNDILTANLRLFLAITCCGILIFAFGYMNLIIPSILLPFAYAMLQIVPMNVAFSPWTQTLPWMMLGGFLLANVLESTGVLKRVAYFCILKAGGSFKGILYGIGIAGLVIGTVQAGQFIIFATLSYGICKALNLGQSKASAAIMLTGAMATMIPTFVFYGGTMLFLGQMASAVTPVPMDYVTVLKHNLIFIPWLFVVIFVISKMFKAENPIQGKAYFEEEYKKLGKLSKNEWKAIALLVVLLIYLFTAGIHKLDSAYGFVLVGCLCFFPGINIGTDQDVRNVNYSMAFFITACLSIGQVSAVLGLGNIVADLVKPLFVGVGTVGTLGLIWLIAFLCNFLLTPYAEIAALTVPITTIGMAQGISPYPILYVFSQGLDQLLFPYEVASYLCFFSYGLISMKHFVKLFGVKTILNIFYILVCCIPYWKIIGLL